MFTLTEILIIILMHWIADFIFQDEKWALGKSKNNKDLLNHTSMYSLIVWIFVLIMFEDVFKAAYFWLITLITHTITDYITSRIVSKRFEDKHFGSPIPNFGGFTIIGFDQVLHYIQLFGTYYILKP